MSLEDAHPYGDTGLLFTWPTVLLREQLPTFDPRLGAVVVASHIPDLKDGDILADVNWPF